MTLTAIEVDGIREGLGKLAIDRNDRTAAKAAAIWHYTNAIPETATELVAQSIAAGVACWLQYDTEASTTHRCAEAGRWIAKLGAAIARDVRHLEMATVEG